MFNALDKKDAAVVIQRVYDKALLWAQITRQRDEEEWRVNMFAERSIIEVPEGKARFVLPHRPFARQGWYDQEVIDDYKAHFPLLDEFIRFLVMSRFAKDR